MTRPVPTQILHFTRVEHLATIAQHGLLSDALAQQAGLLTVEVGNQGIKGDRALRAVPIAPGGVVAGYAPFYYAARSPMLSSIYHGRVPTYQDGIDRLVYLVSTVEKVRSLGGVVLMTDRNAVLEFAEFWSLDSGEPAADFVDWPLMREKYWANTAEDPQRRERRMAECLVHEMVPFEAFSEVVVKSSDVAEEARAVLAGNGAAIPVIVRPGWYF